MKKWLSIGLSTIAFTIPVAYAENNAFSMNNHYDITSGGMSDNLGGETAGEEGLNNNDGNNSNYFSSGTPDTQDPFSSSSSNGADSLGGFQTSLSDTTPFFDPTKTSDVEDKD